MPPALALLVASAALAQSEVQAQAPPVGPGGVVEGVAVVEGGDTPLPGVSVRLDTPGGPGKVVTADDRGRLRLAGDEVTAEPKVRDGAPGPGVRVRLPDPRWPAEVATARADAFGSRPDAWPGSEQARAFWRVRNGRATLVVACPPAGELEVTVRGPDGAPLADRGLLVTPVGPSPMADPSAAVRLRARTDAAGRFRTRWFAGVRSLHLEAPGVGFGFTGAVEVRDDRTAQAGPPPLARFGRVEGTVDAGLRGPGTVAVVGEAAWDERRGEVDAAGRFAIDDVTPGRQTVQLLRGGRPLRAAPAVVTVAPGGLARVDVRGPEPARRDGRPDEDFRIVNRVLAEGTVQDEEGRPLAGARVLVRAQSYGNIMLEGESPQTAMTDAEGRFRVEGPVHNLMGPLTVWALSPGRPPATAFTTVAREPGGRRPPMTVTMARRGADVRFDVRRDGRPVSGVSVELEPSPLGPDDWSPGLDLGEPSDRAMEPVRRAFSPYARTGADGVARFRDVAPGLYRAKLQGSLDEADWKRRQQGGADELAPSATVVGVAAAAGRETRYAVALHPLPYQTRVKLGRPDGSPPADRLVVLGYDREVPRVLAPWSEVDRQGVTTLQFGGPGLTVVRARFRDTTFPAQTDGGIDPEPYFEATAVVPLSPALPLPDPLPLTAQRRVPGSVRARLVDTNGKPARGTVWLETTFGRGGNVRQAGSTDADGEVGFRDVPGGPLVARGFIDGQPPAPDATDTGAFPGPEDLRGRLFVPEVPVEVRPGGEAVVTLTLRPAAYVQGVLRPPAGRDADEFDLAAWRDDPMKPFHDRRERGTGRFLVGPLTAGSLWLATGESRRGNDAVAETGRRRVEVPDGGVIDVTLEPSVTPAGPAPGLPGVGNGSLRVAIAALPPGKVVRAEGGPAAGALALLFVPGEHDPVAAGVADADGRLTWGGVPSRSGRAVPPPDRPTAVVRLPGAAGAVLTEVVAGQTLRVTLPRPVSVTGRVTLGGGPFAGRNSRVRVVAAPRGRGAFAAVLRVEASADADGRFTLHGLTPGDYTVQAARDGIWLSRSAELTVSPDRPPPELTFDIPEPGEAVAVTVVDDEGRPVADRPVRPVRPEGPLADLWPDAFRTDASGTVVIRGLEEGTHRLLVEGRPTRDELRVGKATRPAAAPVPVHVRR